MIPCDSAIDLKTGGFKTAKHKCQRRNDPLVNKEFCEDCHAKGLPNESDSSSSKSNSSSNEEELDSEKKKDFEEKQKETATMADNIDDTPLRKSVEHDEVADNDEQKSDSKENPNNDKDTNKHDSNDPDKDSAMNKGDEHEIQPGNIVVHPNTPTEDVVDNTHQPSGIQVGEKEEAMDVDIQELTNMSEIQNKESQLDSRVTKLEVLKRYVSPRAKAPSSIEEAMVPIVSKLPDDKYQQVIECIEKHFDMIHKKGNLYSQFQNLNEAQVALCRRFGYMNEESDNIMNFKFPEFMKHCVDDELKVPQDIGLHVQWKSMIKVFSQDWLDDEMINFVMDCFNMVTIKKGRKGVIPSLLFGHTHDACKIIPQENEFPTLALGVDEPLDSRGEDFYPHYFHEMKKWYCLHSKGILQKILDYCHLCNIKIQQYGAIINISDAHWIYVRFNPKTQRLGSNTTFPCVFTYDSKTNKNGYAARRTRRWYSKFFGLHMKEIQQGVDELDPEDMNGFDIMGVEEFTFPLKLKNIDYPSLTEVDNIDVPVKQDDGVNCGVFCLIKAWEDKLKINKCAKFNDESLQQQRKATASQLMFRFCNDFRNTLCSLVYDIFVILHGYRFNAYKQILEMDPSIPLERMGDLHWKKWTMIVRLFETGKYKVLYGTQYII